MPNKTAILTFLTHALSATGALLAFLAIEAIYTERWELAFLWMGIALIVDGIDGPIARHVGVEEYPRFSGGRIDLIVDYLNYVFVPALAFAKVAILPPTPSMIMVIIILMTSLYHFADTQSKADDHSFVGFPAIWNVVIFYLFVFQPPAIWTALIVLVFALLTFQPLRWTHPLRNTKFRPITIGVTVLAALAALWILYTGFMNPAPLARTVLLLAAAYGLALVTLYATIWRKQ